jgi:hypothetical protein
LPCLQALFTLLDALREWVEVMREQKQQYFINQQPAAPRSDSKPEISK